MPKAKYFFIAVVFSLSSSLLFSQKKNVFEIARKGSLREMQSFYKKHPEAVNTIDDKKSSPLILACYRSNEQVALFLAEKTKNIDYNSGMGTAVIATVMAGNTMILGKLIELKADLNQTDANGKTALIYASFFNKVAIVKQLIDAGADKNLKDVDGRTALDYATFNKNKELLVLLD